MGLSALYFYICQKLDIQVSIINFNGYYAIRYYDSVTHFYIDPYNKGIFFTPEEVQSFLKQLNQEENLMHYKPLSNIYVILHIINLVIVLNKKEGEDDKAERFKELLRNIEIKMP